MRRRGFSKMAHYSKFWTSDTALRGLALTAEEHKGDFTRVSPTSILKDPAFSPVFGCFNPCGSLAKSIRKVVAHDDALAGSSPARSHPRTRSREIRI
jgi:hypothetical protein